MNRANLKARLASACALSAITFQVLSTEAIKKVDVRFPTDSIALEKAGRLFLVFASTNDPEPRFLLGNTGPNPPVAFAVDVTNAHPGANYSFDNTSFGYPVRHLNQVPPGNYFVQALFDCNRDLRTPNAPGNLFTPAKEIRIGSSNHLPLTLDLSERVRPEVLPTNSDYLKFVRIQSKLLSEFHHRPIYLRAGVVLPRSRVTAESEPYSMWVRVGGLNTRYTTVTKLMKEGSEFAKLWSAKDTPQFILVQLDGAGPLGDPYYINSENNGPYGDALMTELLPYIEQQYGTKNYTGKRVVSGVSTGGWVCMALQVFHPDQFQGAWAACPDPIDFRALQQINIYSEQNAYTDRNGAEIGSDRDKKGNVLLTVREECAAERLLGFGNNFAYSGEQWGEWTAAFSPRSPSGGSQLLWNPDTGALDPSVAKSWEKFDLRLVLERNWTELAPKLRGKLHISAGEADRFYLNKAVHLFDEAVSRRSPPLDAEIAYGPGKGHGWSHLTTAQMLQAMQKSINE